MLLGTPFLGKPGIVGGNDKQICIQLTGFVGNGRENILIAY